MINFDGGIFPDTAAYLNANNRAFSQGDALVETLRVVDGKVIFWEEHYLRLMAAMRILRMEIPMNFTPEFLQGELIRTIRESGLTHQPVRASIYVFPKNITEKDNDERSISYIITLQTLSSPFYLFPEVPYEADLYKDFYVQAGMLATLPTICSFLMNLGGVYARENGFADCFLLNDQKNLVQTLKGNLFLVVKDKIKTPPLTDGCDNSVLRKKVMALISSAMECELEETSISPFELQKADEIFISEIEVGIQSVTRYRRTEFKTDVAKEVLGKLNAAARLS